MPGAISNFCGTIRASVAARSCGAHCSDRARVADRPTERATQPSPMRMPVAPSARRREFERRSRRRSCRHGSTRRGATRSGASGVRDVVLPEGMTAAKALRPLSIRWSDRVRSSKHLYEAMRHLRGESLRPSANERGPFGSSISPNDGRGHV
jgi:hypothetical protein